MFSNNNRMHQTRLFFRIFLLSYVFALSESFHFCPQSISRHCTPHIDNISIHRIPNTRLGAIESFDDNASRELARARSLLEQSKAKISAQQEEEEESGQLPFFIKESAEEDEKRNTVTKTKNNENGLITTDGELMAALSEEESWERRGLLDVFENELKEESDASKQLARRDVAASIRNLRIRMHGDDYRKIFDKSNRFIGEDN